LRQLAAVHDAPDNSEPAGLQVSHQLLCSVSVNSLFVISQLAVRNKLRVNSAACHNTRNVKVQHLYSPASRLSGAVRHRHGRRSV